MHYLQLQRSMVNTAHLLKLYALDTIGGAIKVEYSSGAGTEDLEINVTE